MRVPRPRFSVRSVMIVVVICALMLWLAPICERVIWTWIVIRDVKRGEAGRYSKQGYERAGPRAVDALREALRKGQRKTRLAAAQTLGVIGSAAEPAVLALIDTALHDQSRDVRIYAIGSLGEIGPGAFQAVEPLLGLLRHDEDPHIILATIEALGRIGPGARSGIPALAAMLKEPRHFAWNFERDIEGARSRIGQDWTGRAKGSSRAVTPMLALPECLKAGRAKYSPARARSYPASNPYAALRARLLYR